METKIPFYNILNMFLTGTLFIILCVLMFPDNVVLLLTSSFILELTTGAEVIGTVCIFVSAYEIGLIINRIGSIFLEPALKKLHIIKFSDDYAAYNKAKSQYPVMDILSREYALSRTRIALFLMALVLAGASRQYRFACAYLVLILLFAFSARKHSQKIVDLIASSKKEHSLEVN